MGYSTFAKISISPEKRKEYYQQQIDELIDIIQSSDDDDNLSVKDAQKKKKQLETRLKNLNMILSRTIISILKTLALTHFLLMKHIISKIFP